MPSTRASSSLQSDYPKVVNDPRFKAGRKLVTTGSAEAAFNLFASLLEQARRQYGDDDVETAPAYYEYGNALLRQYQRNKQEQTNTVSPTAIIVDKRLAAAEAALKRARQQDIMKQETDERKPAAAFAPTNAPKGGKGKEGTADDVNSDLTLALELMETSWSILDASSFHNNNWRLEQIPRVLTGIGDVLAEIGRHADAADAYLRALACRQEHLESFEVGKKESIEFLKCRRRIVEANVLIAEELLACPEGVDVMTTESRDVLVPSGERSANYARDYYEKARDQLQETVLLMGHLAAKKVEGIDEEKEDICFTATLVMGVGEALARLDEEWEAALESAEPLKKKGRAAK
jgi:tetratricopeptide (TPR) repeat protein